MTDRIPTYPGRVKLEPVTGQTNIYTISMADQPSVAGTPLNKATLLTDAAASAVDTAAWGETATVSDALLMLARRAADFDTLIKALWSGGLTIYHQPDDVTAAANDTAYFHVGAISASSITYQWQYSTDNGSTWSNTSITGNKTATLKPQATAARNGYQYRCNVTSGGTTTASNAATLTVV